MIILNRLFVVEKNCNAIGNLLFVGRLPSSTNRFDGVTRAFPIGITVLGHDTCAVLIQAVAAAIHPQAKLTFFQIAWPKPRKVVLPRIGRVHITGLTCLVDSHPGTGRFQHAVAVGYSRRRVRIATGVPTTDGKAIHALIGVVQEQGCSTQQKSEREKYN